MPGIVLTLVEVLRLVTLSVNHTGILTSIVKDQETFRDPNPSFVVTRSVGGEGESGLGKIIKSLNRFS